MRKETFTDVKLDSFPARSQGKMGEIMNIMNLAFGLGYTVSSNDANTGLLQFCKGDLKINWYTTKNTVLRSNGGRQESLGKLSLEELKELLIEKG